MRHRLAIYELLKKMQYEKEKTIIAITHDINLACQYAQTALLLEPGLDYAAGAAAEIFNKELLEKAFSVKLREFRESGYRMFMPAPEAASSQ